MVLPTLPAGWKYESWIGATGSSDPIPYSCGEFYSPDGADSDGCGGGAGTGGFFPEFPGGGVLGGHAQQNYPGGPVPPDPTRRKRGLPVNPRPPPTTGPQPVPPSGALQHT